MKTEIWRRGLVEAVFILASILLAFWIDAWWEGRGELRFEAEVRDAFIDELNENQAYAREVISRNETILLRIDRFIRASPDELRGLPADTVEAWVSSMHNVRAHQPLAAASSMLLQTPPSTSQGLALRTLVGRYEQRTSSVEDGYASLDPWRQLIWERLAPHAAGEFGAEGTGLSAMIARRGPDAMMRIRADSALVAALVAKAQAQRLYQNLLSRMVMMGDSVELAIEALPR